MRPRNSTVLLLAGLLLLVAPAPAHAFWGALAKLGKLGKVAKAGKAVTTGAKAAKLAKVGGAAAGMTGAVAAERAGLAFAGLGDDAARSATYLARGADGQLLQVTRAAGTEKIAADSLGTMSVAGERPSAVFLDLSAADTAPALAREHPGATLALVDGEKRLPLLKKPGGQVGDLVVDTGTNLVDLNEYLGGDGSDQTTFDDVVLPVGLSIGVLGATLWWVLKRRNPAVAA